MSDWLPVLNWLLFSALQGLTGLRRDATETSGDPRPSESKTCHPRLHGREDVFALFFCLFLFSLHCDCVNACQKQFKGRGFILAYSSRDPVYQGREGKVEFMVAGGYCRACYISADKETESWPILSSSTSSSMTSSLVQHSKGSITSSHRATS